MSLLSPSVVPSLFVEPDDGADAADADDDEESVDCNSCIDKRPL